MQKQYDNTNKGSFFVNDQKKTENHPDYSGKINVGGTEFYLSGWKKVSKAGKPFMSLSVKPVAQQANAGNNGAANYQAPVQNQQPAGDVFAQGGDEIPF